MKIFGKNQDGAENSQSMKRENNEKSSKDKIYNLVILDKSGSMSSIAEAAISGFNETVGGIRAAQEKYAETQEHFVSLMIFCNCEKRLVYDNVPVAEVKQLTSRDYRPCCCTPLYDAMGISISKLRGDIANVPNATAIVTVITDGLENASKEYSGQQVKKMVDELKEQGWTFAYMGADHDVEAVASRMSFDNVHRFSHDSQGMSDSWNYERKARMNFFSRLHNFHSQRESLSESEINSVVREMSSNYYQRESPEINSKRITPDRITSLADNEIFVFGSDVTGNHNGGAALFAVRNFGAVNGQNFGLQGHSFAIPTTNVSLREIAQYVHKFIEFAKQHPESKFLVTRIGCGIAGFTEEEIAPLFKEAQKLDNVYLPKSFWIA